MKANPVVVDAGEAVIVNADPASATTYHLDHLGRSWPTR